MTKEEKFIEAIELMKLLKLSEHCIKAFAENKVWTSEGYGALYEVTQKEQKLIDNFEENHPNCLVYHMIHNKFEFGECYSMLYVSSDKEEWEFDKEDIKDGYVFAWVENIDSDWCSEFGTIGVKPSFGGLIRVS